MSPGRQSPAPSRHEPGQPRLLLHAQLFRKCSVCVCVWKGVYVDVNKWCWWSGVKCVWVLARELTTLTGVTENSVLGKREMDKYAVLIPLLLFWPCLCEDEDVLALCYRIHNPLGKKFIIFHPSFLQLLSIFFFSHFQFSLFCHFICSFILSGLLTCMYKLTVLPVCFSLPPFFLFYISSCFCFTFSFCFSFSDFFFLCQIFFFFILSFLPVLSFHTSIVSSNSSVQFQHILFFLFCPST